jgi:hypothetical protein
MERDLALVEAREPLSLSEPLADEALELDEALDEALDETLDLRLEDGAAELLDWLEPEADDAMEATEVDLWRLDPFDFRETSEAEDFLDDPPEERDLDLLETLLDLEARLDLVTALLSLSLSELELALFLEGLDFELFVDGAEASDSELEARLLRDDTDGELLDGTGEPLALPSGRGAFKSAFGVRVSGAGGFEMPFEDPFTSLPGGDGFAGLGFAFVSEPFGGPLESLIGFGTTSRGAESSPLITDFPRLRLAGLILFTGSASWFSVICESWMPALVDCV